MDDIEKIIESMADEVSADLNGNSIISEFKSWVADMQMQGKIIHPDRKNFREWLLKNHPQHAGSYKALWKEHFLP